jgi:hypothetical protein
MGKTEISTSSIGIKITLSDLILQINENNVNIIKDMLYNSFISDSNVHFNNAYQQIIFCNELPENYLDCKEYLETEFRKKGSNDLLEKELLLPIKKILQTNRWGYDRYGKNGSYRPLDFDLSVDIEKYKEIEKYTIVFISEQYSG